MSTDDRRSGPPEPASEGEQSERTRWILPTDDDHDLLDVSRWIGPADRAASGGLPAQPTQSHADAEATDELAVQPTADPDVTAELPVQPPADFVATAELPAKPPAESAASPEPPVRSPADLPPSTAPGPPADEIAPVAISSPVRPPRDRARTIARGVGQTLITAGVIVLLFVVYELWITDIFSGEKQASATQHLDQLWAPTTTAPSSAAASRSSSAATVAGTKVVQVNDPNKYVTDPKTRHPTYQTFDGQGFAKIYIPSFGADYVYTIIEGTGTSDLDVGPGHYADTQFPGQPGNFAIAGHRVSKGSPFNALGALNSCDALVVETKDDWFIYRVLPMGAEATGWKTAGRPHCSGVAPLTGEYAKVFGREITDPSDYAQVLPVPHINSTDIPASAKRLITLTTCHPQFSDSQRMIIHGTLVKSYKKAGGFLPPELKES